MATAVARPAVGAFAGTAAAVILVVWANDRRKPARLLTISADEIVFGRLEEPGTAITREHGSRLEMRYVYKAGTFLAPVGQPKPAIPMTGFKQPEVRAACEQYGWTIA